MEGITQEERKQRVESLQRPSTTSFSQVSLTIFLDAIEDPVFVLDLTLEGQLVLEPDCLQPTYTNVALTQTGFLANLDKGKFPSVQHHYRSEGSYQDFMKWARQPEASSPSSTAHHVRCFSFGDAVWDISATLSSRWRIITADIKHEITHSKPNKSSSITEEPPETTPVAISNHQNIALELDNQPRPTNSPAPSTIETNTNTSSRSDSSSPQSSIKSNSSIAKIKARDAKQNADLLSRISAFPAVGIYITDGEGEILFCSDAWYEITQYPRHRTNAMEWVKVFDEDEMSRVLDIWKRVIMDQEAVYFEAKLKRHWKPPPGDVRASEVFPVWISAYTCPEVSEEGEIIGASGVLTDITEKKWIAHIEEQKLMDAIERASLLEQLATQEQRFRNLAEFMPIGIWMSDRAGQLLYSNQNYYELTATTSADTSVKSWLRSLSIEDQQRVEDHLEEVWTNMVSFSLEVGPRKLRIYPGTSHGLEDSGYSPDIWFLLSAYPDMYEDGSVKHLVGCITDITDLKRAEAADKKELQRQKEAKAQLEQFIDMTSHEMRNPLGAIVHLADDIITTIERSEASLRSTLDQINSITDAANTILYSTKHSTRIVDDILTVSKVDSKLLKITPIVVQPVTTIQDAFNMFNAEMKAAGIDQHFIVDSSIEELGIKLVRLDPTRVLQVFVNLITNAIKFTRPRSVRNITVTISASLNKPTGESSAIHYLSLKAPELVPAVDNSNAEDVAYLQISVKDTGCGLIEEDQAKLFRRYAQAQTRTHVNYGGTGLGLFISRQLCEMQGGQIGLKSVYGKGSTFAFYVAITRVTSEVAHDDTEYSKSTLNPVTDTSHLKLSRRRLSSEQSTLVHRKSTGPDVNQNNVDIGILLVEDNIINQKVMERQLSKNGFPVAIANHGIEALACIETSGLWQESAESSKIISIVLLDIEMPVMGGLECVKRIREIEREMNRSHRIPVVAITANARDEQINEAKEAGMVRLNLSNSF